MSYSVYFQTMLSSGTQFIDLPIEALFPNFMVKLPPFFYAGEMKST